MSNNPVFTKAVDSEHDFQLRHKQVLGLSHVADFSPGMELFEEALQKWEQALNIRHQTLSTSSNNSLALEGAACGDPPVVMKFLSFCTCGVFEVAQCGALYLCIKYI